MTDWRRIHELVKQAATKTYLSSKDPEVCRRKLDRQNARERQKRAEQKRKDTGKTAQGQIVDASVIQIQTQQ